MFAVNRLPFRTIAFLCCLIGLSGCFKNLDPFQQSTHYQIVGLEDDDDTRDYLNKILQQRVADNLQYEEGTDDFARAAAAREQTIANDLVKAMRAKGYYDAKVDYVDDADNVLSGEYRVTGGVAYTIASLKITPETSADRFDHSIITQGDVLEALPVLQAQTALYDAEQKGRCYFSLDVTHSVVLDEQSKTAALEFHVNAGPTATFGPALFEGHETVKDAYLSKMVTWREGDCFRHERIQRLQTKLLESGLFVRAEGELPAAPDEDGRVAVTMHLKERVHRSVKAGASYYTDQGAGIVLGWEHRNVLGEGEKLQAELNISQMNQSLDLDFTKPFFWRKDQSLELSTAVRRQDTDAFEELAFDISSALKRQINRHLTASLGVHLSVKEITDEFGQDTYGLMSIPANLTYDNRDNALDPHRGWLVNAAVEPFYDTFGESDPFTKFELGARTYLALSDSPDIVLALRANAGTLYGGEMENVPATERFYAGGGGSIRGFGYQQVGPFKNGDPTGGRSMVTGSAELRTKFTDSMGGVAFVDAGSISEDRMPDLQNLSVGAGIGFRYYTDFGPLRFDVAVPLNHKDDLDENYQFYISIGQAF